MRSILLVCFFSLPLVLLAQTDRATGHILADFKGGHAEFHQLVMLEMYYPRDALLNKERGKVILEVLIEPTGKTYVTRTIKSPGPALEEEARRLVSLAEFIPASMDGSPMQSRKTVSIRFSPRKYQHYVEVRGYDKIPTPKTPIAQSKHVYPLDSLKKSSLPLYPKKFNSFESFIYKTLKYPEGAFTRNIEGKTIIEFVVEPSGNITNMYPIEYLGAGCYEEAKRVLRSIPWQPAIVNGKAVRSRQVQTIIFQLPN